MGKMRTGILAAGVVLLLVGVGLFIFLGFPYLSRPAAGGKVKIPFTDWEITVGVQEQQSQQGLMFVMFSAAVGFIGLVLVIVGLAASPPSRRSIGR